MRLSLGVHASALLLACALVGACGSSGSVEPAGTAPTVDDGTIQVPSTMQAVAGDLTVAGQWLGHVYLADMMAAPFQKVFLDGRDTGYVTLSIACGPGGEMRSACPAIVRLESLGYGYDLGSPGDWMVLTYLPDPSATGGPVLDALAVTTSENGLLMSGCWAADGGVGQYFGFARYPPADYRPTGDPDVDAAATPMVLAWKIEQGRLTEVPADTVRCNNYTWGD